MAGEGWTVVYTDGSAKVVRGWESAIALIPMYNSGIDRLRRLEPNMDQSC